MSSFPHDVTMTVIVFQTEHHLEDSSPAFQETLFVPFCSSFVLFCFFFVTLFRFQKTIDVNLPLHMQFTMNHVITFTSVVTVVSLADWWMVILLIPLGLSFLDISLLFLFFFTFLFIHSHPLFGTTKTVPESSDSSASNGGCDTLTYLCPL